MTITAADLFRNLRGRRCTTKASAAGATTAESDPAAGIEPTAPAAGVRTITEVLAGHQVYRSAAGLNCYAADADHYHGQFYDWKAWREHIAPLIDQALIAAWKQRDPADAVRQAHLALHDAQSRLCASYAHPYPMQSQK